jgi:flagellar basal-body rod protein FlgC
MDVIASNISNAETTRARYVNGQWEPYKRKMVRFEPNNQPSFAQTLQNAMADGTGQGVKVTDIVEDTSPMKQVYDPSHPDANAQGYVMMPNVDMLKEMVDMISATRSYEANVTAINASKAMIMKALEIGK